MTAGDRVRVPDRRRSWNPGLVAGAVAMLAAAFSSSSCAGTAERAAGASPEPRPAIPAAEAPASEAPASEALVSETPVSALSVSEPPPARREVAVAAAAVAQPEKTYPEPASLRGLDGGQLTDLLGQPRFKRRDDPAEIWQYRTAACALDLFLYRGIGDQAYRVRHLEARGRVKGPPQSEKDCLVSLLKAREQGRSG